MNINIRKFQIQRILPESVAPHMHMAVKEISAWLSGSFSLSLNILFASRHTYGTHISVL